jgi:serine/threonine-protein kinase
MRAATLVEGKFDVAAAEPHYLETFAKAGLGGPGDDPDAVAARVRASAVCAELVAALDDWACITPDGARMEWLLAVARAADPDPARNRLRRPDLWQDGRDLARVVQKLGVEEQSPQLARAVARVLRRDGGDPIPLLSAAQAQFPQDFWLNFLLGWLLRDAGRSEEAIGFLRAAEALRPEASPVQVALGLSLLVTGRRDEATRHFEQAVHLDPTYALAHGSLGIALWQGGRLDKAIPHLREAVRGDPESSAPLRCHLGEALLKEGHLDEAIRHLREAIRGGPAVSARAHTLLGDALRFEGRADEAIGHYREAVRSDPKAPAGTHYRLANALRDKRQPEEAVDHLQQAVQLDPEYTQAWVALGLT